jgi:hypothetical protein
MSDFDLTRFVDRGASGRFIHQKGHTSHAQAGAKLHDDRVIFLLLQGRQTDVRAHWALFHERQLEGYARMAGKESYVKPNPRAVLPSGVEIAIVHRDLTPVSLAHDAEVFYTFGPPHFGLMFLAATPVPMLPHWEQPLWDMGQRVGLVTAMPATWNVRVWCVRIDPEQWLRTMAQHHTELTY